MRHNLLLSPGTPWPNPAIKKVNHAARKSWFSPEDAVLLKGDRKHISMLQSTDSEDAITWSVFGTASEHPMDVRVGVLNWICAALAQPARNTVCEILLWKRHAHPQTRDVNRGPEMDFVLVGDQSVVFGEAKWRSSEGRSQGVQRNKSQSEIREEYVSEFGERDYPGRELAFVALERTPGAITHREGGNYTWHRLSWAHLTGCKDHPLQESYAAYLQWKEVVSEPWTP